MSVESREQIVGAVFAECRGCAHRIVFPEDRGAASLRAMPEPRVQRCEAELEAPDRGRRWSRRHAGSENRDAALELRDRSVQLAIVDQYAHEVEVRGDDRIAIAARDRCFDVDADLFGAITRRYDGGW